MVVLQTKGDSKMERKNQQHVDLKDKVWMIREDGHKILCARFNQEFWATEGYKFLREPYTKEL